MEPSHSGDPLVVIDHVNKHFGELHVLKDISTTVARGEVVVVIGPSGSGKSTLCRAINRLETIDDGSITVDGRPLPEEGKALAQLRAEVGMVFQSFNLFAHKTVLENVTLGPRKVRGQSKAAADKRAMELLDRVGVANQASKVPSQLSGGQQQRVFLARALVQEAELYLLDEPFAGVDAASEAALVEVLRRLNAQGATVVAVHHDLTTLASYFDWIALLNVRLFAQGPLAATLTPEALQAAYGGRLPLLATLAPEEVRRAV